MSELFKKRILCMDHNETQIKLKGKIKNRVLAEVADALGLYLGATKRQGAGCVRPCPTFSVLVKQTYLVNVVL